MVCVTGVLSYHIFIYFILPEHSSLLIWQIQFSF